ncbi:solute carrier family 35 member G2-like [Saccoglossus kowalevskii]|uniref:Solute carrier family 35 member G2-like n=1 Tax=Saccoglossus kowalevskii TaxID=10224 RepID=A0ABM0M7J5_SACKO|nr:PREDICTED: solute carrier family 35 member G2-like [Saccoglossus kowalevskii]
MGKYQEKTRLLSDEVSQQLRPGLATVLKSATGVFLALLSGVLDAFNGIFYTLIASGGIPPIQVAFLYSISVLVLSTIPALLYLQDTVLFKSVKINTLLVGIGAATAVGSSTEVYAVYHLPLGNEYAVYAGITPIFCAVGSIIFNGERLKISHVLGFLIITAGTVLIMRPTFIFGDIDTPMNETIVMDSRIDTTGFAYTMTICSSFFHSLSCIMWDAISDDVTTFVKIFYMNCISGLICLTLSLVMETQLWTWSLKEISYVSALALCSASFVCAFHSSLQMEGAVTVNLLTNVQVVVAFILQVCITNIQPGKLDIAGTVLVILGSAVISVCTWWDHVKNQRMNTQSSKAIDYNNEMATP